MKVNWKPTKTPYISKNCRAKLTPQTLRLEGRGLGARRHRFWKSVAASLAKEARGRASDRNPRPTSRLPCPAAYTRLGGRGEGEGGPSQSPTARSRQALQSPRGTPGRQCPQAARREAISTPPLGARAAQYSALQICPWATRGSRGGACGPPSRGGSWPPAAAAQGRAAARRWALAGPPYLGPASPTVVHGVGSPPPNGLADFAFEVAILPPQILV
jgi:hypothetical protein